MRSGPSYSLKTTRSLWALVFILNKRQSCNQGTRWLGLGVGRAEISGKALGCSSVLRTSGKASPSECAQVRCVDHSVGGGEAGGCLVVPPLGCHTCLTSPSTLSFRLLWAWLAPGPYLSFWSQESESLLALLGVGVGEGACIQITPWKTKHCLKGLREGPGYKQVLPGSVWQEARPGEEWEERERGEGRKGCRHCVPSERLWVCLSRRGTSKFVPVCVCVAWNV